MKKAAPSPKRLRRWIRGCISGVKNQRKANDPPKEVYAGEIKEAHEEYVQDAETLLRGAAALRANCFFITSHPRMWGR